MSLERTNRLKLEKWDAREWAFNRPTEWEFFDYKFERALDAEATGNVQKAEEIYIEIIKGCPDHLASINNLGLLFLERGELDAAIAMFENAVSLGTTCFPDEFNSENDFISWYYEDNRSFLIAYENLGKCYLEKSLKTLKNLDRVNPGFRGIAALTKQIEKLYEDNQIT